MSRLPELQRAFAGALFDGDLRATALLAPAKFSAEERLGVYRNNLRAGFAGALRDQFPVLLMLVGEDYFAQLAVQFLRAHPSRSGNLQGVGAPLPQFLRAVFAAGRYAYFADVAELEWARQQAATAEDAPPLDPQRLTRFALHPSARIVTSAWPLLAIWQAHQLGGDPASVQLDAGAEQIRVYRAADGIRMHGLTAAQSAFLQALGVTGELDRAYDAALDHDLNFDVAAELAALARDGVIINAETA